MKVSEAAKLWLEHHKCHSKENSIRAYQLVLTKFCDEFGNEDLKDITTERALSFLNRVTEAKNSKQRKHVIHICWLFSILLKTILIRNSATLVTLLC